MTLGRRPVGLKLLNLASTHLQEGVGIVDANTEIVIEGYPRSANTFAVAAFLVAQQRPVRIGHHVHGPAQVILALKYDIPAMILIRNPLDAITSLLVRQPYLKVDYAFENYLRFYEKLLPVQGKAVIAPFEDVVGNFGQVIQRVNQVFGTCFYTFEHTDDSLMQVFQLVEQMDRKDRGRQEVSEATVARPSRERVTKKAAIHEQLLDGPYTELIDQSLELYRDYLLHRR